MHDKLIVFFSYTVSSKWNCFNFVFAAAEWRGYNFMTLCNYEIEGKSKYWLKNGENFVSKPDSYYCYW